jgi:3-isopropylmalate/(R)-2-methylmalate dehydratase large subunit
VLYIDRHLVHEVTSPQAFEGLALAGRKVRAPEKTLAVVDHNVPTSDRRLGIQEEESRINWSVIDCRKLNVTLSPHSRDRPG